MHTEGTAKDSKRCSNGLGPQGGPCHTNSTVNLRVSVMLLHSFTYMLKLKFGFLFTLALWLPLNVGLDVFGGIHKTHCNLFLQGGKAPAAAVAIPAVYNPVEFKHDLMAPVQQVLGDTLDHIPTAIQSEDKSVSSTLQQQLLQAQQQLERQAEPQAAVQQAWDVFSVFRLESHLGLSKGTHKGRKHTAS